MATEIERFAGDAGIPRASLFERRDWLYAFMREHCFRDDTERIAAALWPDGAPTAGSRMVDVGCGPGTYTRGLASLHPGLEAIGIDRSPRQLRRARERAHRDGVTNCRFDFGDALALPLASCSADAVVAARLLMVLRDPARALAEIHRVLRPGGRCFIAEPRPGIWTELPLAAMRIMAAGSGSDLDRLRAHDDAGWEALLATQPWSRLERTDDRRYRYAVGERAAA